MSGFKKKSSFVIANETKEPEKVEEEKNKEIQEVEDEDNNIDLGCDIEEDNEGGYDLEGMIKDQDAECDGIGEKIQENSGIVQVQKDSIEIAISSIKKKKK